MFQLTIRRRLLLATCVMVTALFVLGGWSYHASQRASASNAAQFDRSAAAANKVAQLREAVWRMVGVEAKIIAVGSNDTAKLESLWTEWKSQVEAAGRLALEIAALDPGSTELASLTARQNAHLQAYVAVVDPIITKLHDVELDGFGALGMAQAAAPRTAALLASIDTILKANERHEASVRDGLARSASTDAMMSLPVIAASLALLLPLMLLTIRSVCRPIDQAVAAAGRIASGDLSEKLQARGDDEMAVLLRSLQHMQDSLRTLVGRVRDSADSIQTASSEVASGNQDLSQRTESTAGHLQQSASAVHELSGTVASTAESARQASALAHSASEVAQRGGTVVSDVVSTMNDINSSSKQITEIINVIDGIAFQTNILALNAAVEAARAGEQGRGFAVVASEVRSLAQRSAGAAREIKVLIGASVNRVEHGVRLVRDAGTTMEEIVSSVRRVTDIISEISHAADEQSSGIGQVSDMVSQLDEATQRNAALVEQSTAAAQSLSQQSDALSELVATFRLAGGGEHASAA